MSKLAPVHDPDCLFCNIVAGELPSTIIDEDERVIAFMDINPATRGHALVVPRNHAKDLLEIAPEAKLPDGTPLSSVLDALGDEQATWRTGDL